MLREGSATKAAALRKQIIHTATPAPLGATSFVTDVRGYQKSLYILVRLVSYFLATLLVLPSLLVVNMLRNSVAGDSHGGRKGLRLEPQ